MSAGDRKLRNSRVEASACRLLLVRHATAEGHGRFQGQRDVSLSSAGRRELPRLCERCSRYPIRAVYASDLRRARETAEAVARNFGLEVEVRPELREIHFGEWEGLTWNQISGRYPKLATRWVKRFPHQTIPGGEPLSKFQRRIAAGVRKVVDANRGHCVLLVTHAGVIRLVLAKILGLPAPNLFRLSQDSCALNVIDFLDGSAIVHCVNG